MTRILVRWVVGIVILLAMLAGAATAVGHGMHTGVVTIAANPVSTVLSDEMVIRLVDLDRFLPVTIPIPIPSVRDVMLAPNGQSALLLTRSVSRAGSSYGLYYFHILSGEFWSLFNHESSERDTSLYRISNIYQFFSPSFSPDGTMIVLMVPDGQRVVVYNLETGTRTVVQELRFPSQYLRLNWSPDGSQIAYRELDSSLVVVNIDGTNRRRFEDMGSGTPAWSPDGRWLMMARSETTGAALIRVLDPQTGRPHPQVGELEGASPAWSCDGQWLSYINPSRQIQLHHLETGETTNLHHAAPLDDVRFRLVGWLQDCTRMILIGLNDAILNVSQPMIDSGPLYLLDTNTMEVSLLTDYGLLMGIFGDELLYTRFDLSTGRSRLFLVHLETQDTQFLVEVPHLNIWVRPVDQSRALYSEPITRQIKLMDLDERTVRDLLPEGETMFNFVTWQTG